MSKYPPIVKKDDERPAGKGSGHCFYCPGKIGKRHAEDCVLWTKKVLVRMTVEYPREVPMFWTQNNIEFHLNEGTWCGDNAVDELQELPDDYVCQHSEFKYIKDLDEETDEIKTKEKS